jgi:hypothetical protein
MINLKKLVCVLGVAVVLAGVGLSVFSPVASAQSNLPGTPASESAEREPGFELLPGATPDLDTFVPLSITLSPVTLSLETNPGETKTTEIKIRNNSIQPELLTISVGTFTADASGERPVITDIAEGDEFINWVSFSEPEFEVPPNEWKTIQVTFAPPANAALSYYYALSVRRVKEPVVAGQTTLTGMPTILMLTSVVSPNARKELEIVSVSQKSPFVEFLPQYFDIKVKNKGNVHVVPFGNIFIDNGSKKDVAILAINPGRNAILPQTERVYRVKWNEGFPTFIDREADAKAKAEGKPARPEGSSFRVLGLEFDLNRAAQFRVGRFISNVLLVYDNGERDVPIESKISFWVFPVRLVVVALLIPIVPAVLVYTAMRKKRRD